MSTPALIVIALLLIPAASLGAQARGRADPGVSAGVAPACVPGEESATDSATIMLVLRVWAFDRKQQPPDAELDGIVEAIAARFVLPKPLHMEVFEYTGGDTSVELRRDSLHLTARATARVIAERSGRSRSRELLASTLAYDLDRAFAAAIVATDSVAGFGPFASSVEGETVDLRIELSTVTEGSPELPHQIALAAARVPLFRAQKLPAPLPNQGGPRYPPGLRAAGVTGRVLMRFVVLPDGRAATNTLEVLETTHLDFARAVVKVIPGFRFYPAEIGGCAVPMRVRMPFQFDLR